MTLTLLSALGMIAMAPADSQAASPEVLAEEAALLESLSVKPDELKPLGPDTEVVSEGEPRAIVCHAADAAWVEAARAIQAAVRDATGAELPLVAEADFDESALAGRNVILVGHLDNNRAVARLYHNFYVCLDAGYTGREGHVLRSVHNPFGDGTNYLLVGGSFAEGTRAAAEAFAALVKERAQGNSLSMGRLMELQFDAADRYEPPRGPMREDERDQAIATGTKYFESPGQGRSGVAQLVKWGVRAHRTGDPMALAAYHDLMLALLEYYETDETISQGGMRRYDNDFRDAWTYTVGITWDLLEESGAFTDEERLRATNLLIELALECELYQGWDRDGRRDTWAANEDIVHNHNTFPALGAYFVGNYMRRHYNLDRADDWLTVAHGIFNGQKHVSKPLEDAAAYQWLPIHHVMIYCLAEGDTVFFDEGHARETAQVAMMTMDNAGYQAAFGDHSAYKASSGISTTLKRIAWYHKDPQLLWAAQHAAREDTYPLGQRYDVALEPEPPTGHDGVAVSYLPQKCYDYAGRSPQYPTAPNIPWEDTFDKLTLRNGLGGGGEYLLLDGFGRGTHMHFDTNAIIRYAAGGEPLLVDGEYIRNAPKYHNSMVIIRDGRAELTPAVARLGDAKDDGATAYTRTTVEDYNGADWTREILWVRGAYLVVSDEVTARTAGDFTLRCCWRPWGETLLDGGVLTVDHDPMRMQIVNANQAHCRVEELKRSELMPISRLSQQVSVHLEAGETYRFANLVHAEPQADAIELSISPAEGGVYVVAGAGEAQVVRLGDEAGATEVARGDLPAPVNVTLEEGAGLRGVPEVARSWEFAGFEAPRERLRVETVRCDQPHNGQYGPVQKLFDGQFSSSTYSVMWPHGVTAVVDMAFGEEAEVGTVLLREWHMNEGWDIGSRKLEVSSDGFDQDVREVAAPFEDVGTQSWGGNVNTLMQVEVGERARQLRLTVSPARDDSSVYIAEMEIQGTEPGAAPEIRAIATGDLTGDGTDEVVACSDAGEVVALTASGEKLWSYRAAERAELHTVACGDVNGDGRAEVMFGGGAERLGLLSSEGEELWTAQPQKFRGIASDVMTILPADVDGDGSPEVVCGCKNWQYFAYDANGEMLWGNVIYAHSATVGWADDFDGDGKAEVIGGNAYYTLNLIDHDGERVYSRDRLGPEQTAVSSADVDGDGLPEILMGTDMGELICFDGDGSRLWDLSVGDRVTRIVPVDLTGDGRDEIVVAAESAHVFALNADGTILWRTALPDGVGDLTVVRAGDAPVLAASAGEWGIAFLDAKGAVIGRGKTSARAEQLVAAPGLAITTTAAGALEAFRAP